MRRPAIALFALVGALFALLAPRAARADERAAIDWMRLLVEADALARGDAPRMEGVRPRITDDERRRLVPNELLPSARADAALDPLPVQISAQGSSWFGAARFAFVARDWGSAYRIAGDRLSLMDALRLSRSTRMVMARVRVGGERFRPFAQIGLGQWRTDPSVLPFAPRTLDLAAQTGLGFELCAHAGWHLAVEANVTHLYREPNDRGGLAVPRLLGAMLAWAAPF